MRLSCYTLATHRLSGSPQKLVRPCNSGMQGSLSNQSDFGSSSPATQARLHQPQAWSPVCSPSADGGASACGFPPSPGPASSGEMAPAAALSLTPRSNSIGQSSPFYTPATTWTIQLPQPQLAVPLRAGLGYCAPLDVPQLSDPRSQMRHSHSSPFCSISRAVQDSSAELQHPALTPTMLGPVHFSSGTSLEGAQRLYLSSPGTAATGSPHRLPGGASAAAPLSTEAADDDDWMDVFLNETDRCNMRRTQSAVWGPTLSNGSASGASGYLASAMIASPGPVNSGLQPLLPWRPHGPPPPSPAGIPQQIPRAQSRFARCDDDSIAAAIDPLAVMSGGLITQGSTDMFLDLLDAGCTKMSSGGGAGSRSMPDLPLFFSDCTTQPGVHSCHETSPPATPLDSLHSRMFPAGTSQQHATALRSTAPALNVSSYMPIQNDRETSSDAHIQGCIDGKRACPGSSSERSSGSGSSLDADESGAWPTGARCWPVRHYCVNCTLSYVGTACSSCGHKAGAPPPTSAEVLAAGGINSGPSSLPSTQLRTSIPGSSTPLPTLLAYDDRMLAHFEAGSSSSRSHPERPDRVTAVMARLTVTGLAAQCQQVAGREATIEELTAVHEAALVTAVEQASLDAAQSISDGNGDDDGSPGSPFGLADFLDTGHRRILDCYVNPATYSCARLAAGSAVDVAVAVATGQARNGAAIIRPPGHHAESAVAMGFCYFNNAAIAARAAQKAGARKVLIMDWDVHHGNGTQHIFYDDPTIMYASIHRHDHGFFFPGTGAAAEVGCGAGAGYTVNVPWDGPDATDGDYVAAFKHVILPIAHAFAPDLVIVSAGYDAADGDPLGQCHVSPQMFGHMTAALQEVGPTVLLLEGGYNLTVTATCTEHCMRVLLGDQPAPLPQTTESAAPSPVGTVGIRKALQAQEKYWPGVAEAWVAAGAHCQVPSLLLQRPLEPPQLHSEPQQQQQEVEAGHTLMPQASGQLLQSQSSGRLLRSQLSGRLPQVKMSGQLQVQVPGQVLQPQASGQLLQPRSSEQQQQQQQPEQVMERFQTWSEDGMQMDMCY